MTSSEKNTIQRSPHDKENPYVIVNSVSIKDKKLSWQATGLLAFLLSQSSKWIIRKETLFTNKTNGRDATKKAFDELIKHKYILPIQLFKRNLKNGTKYYLYETPFEDAEEELKKCLRYTENQFAENPRLISNNNNKYKKNNTPKPKSIKSSSPKTDSPPPPRS